MADEGSFQTRTERHGEEVHPAPTPSTGLRRGDILAARYEIQELLGTGGMASVYRAFDRVTEQTIAIKLLDQDRSAARGWVEHLGRELRLARRIKHLNVCQVFDFFEDTGRCFLTMELAPGGNLRDALDESVLRPLAERLTDARAVIDGVAAIHDAGIVHRDLKPENVLRAADGRLMVSDLGVAVRVDMTTHSGGMAGTRSYMAPELVFGEKATKASDVWSLGVTLHEVLFGCRPEWSFAGEVRRLNVPEGALKSPMRDVFRVCAECLVQTPGKRLRDGEAVRRRFEEAVIGRRSPRRWRVALITASLLTLPAIIFSVARKDAGSGPPSILTGKAVDLAKNSVPIFTIHRDITRCAQLLPDGKTLRLFLRQPLEAIDVDLVRGGASPSKLVPEAMVSGCPQLSPDGRRLLYERPREEGRPQILLSDWPDGRNAKVITEGDGPFWLAAGDAFLYAMDANRSAVFVIGRGPALFPDSGLGPRTLATHAVTPTGDQIAVMFNTVVPRMKQMVDLYSYPAMSLLKRLDLPIVGNPWMEFDPTRGSWQTSIGDPEHLVRCELRGDGHCHRLLALEGVDVNASYRSRMGLVAITTHRRRSTSVTRRADGKTQEYVSPGAADLGPEGEAAFNVFMDDGRWAIAVQHFGEGQPRFVTDGPMDVSPAINSDGRTFLFNRGGRDVYSCSIDDGRDCHILHTDSLGPIYPRLSPTGRALAYEVSDAGGPRLRIVTLDGGRTRDLSVRSSGPILWTSDTTLWNCEPDVRVWTEVDAAMGRSTGRQISFSDPPILCEPPPGLADLANFEVRRRVDVTTEVRLVRGM
jgi:serine/threonine protein kinase